MTLWLRQLIQNRFWIVKQVNRRPKALFFHELGMRLKRKSNFSHK